MPSVTINEKGIVSESGSGFAINDGPLLPHIETLTNSASFVLQCRFHDDLVSGLGEGDDGYLNSLNGTVDDELGGGTFVGLYVSFQDGAGDDYYVWFNIDAACTDPGVTGDATGTGFEVAADAADANTLNKVSALVTAAISSGFDVTDVGAGTGQVTLVSLAMGNITLSAQAVNALSSLGDNDEAFSFDSITQPTAAPSITGENPATQGSLKSHGVSVLGSAALDHTVILPAGPGAGAKKTLISTGWSGGTIAVAFTGRTVGDRDVIGAMTATFNAASDVLVLMWNSSDSCWEVLKNDSVVLADV